MLDRAEWDKHCKEKNQARATRDQGALRQLAMAVPPMEALTGDARWDIFTKIAQAKIEDLQEELTQRRAILTDGPYKGTDEIIVQRIEISRLVGKVESLTEMQLVPKILKEQGTRAADLLREHGLEAQ